MTTIKVIERSNYSQRRYERRAVFLARKREEVKTPSRSVEEIWDSIFKTVDETDVLANLLLGIKDIPDVQRKQPRLRKPIMPSGEVTARA
ncbi:hypothetical protein [Providencia alcalifaciens]|uniref:hypothetical protein n=1 Tax=Providencia alcalifaciens TaxID=126385 RepID=UPI001CC44F5B|nr:hypothetical protein [Providencia alcalifaciens]CAG9410804.1 hypothetical protein NVI2019_PLFLNFOB_00677 [Providencia alcalifaciens]CAG9410806.1 hypothetical protein NVI2019_OHEONHNH_00677 [Providencia alcalifaciens]CAG9411002.1 hypothetical protein NVI2019_KOLGMIGM_00678 [Providencia alcalifaciens]CAG9411976.1 hypothetical protein NVI2019_OGMBKCAO_00677 [Providencia alcalifaciens]CAG9412149.1 hypothetical protein NVI2019_ANGEOOBF_00677 [Providencia alcalifaciens]